MILGKIKTVIITEVELKSLILARQNHMQSEILTVSQLNYSVRHHLESHFGQIWLVGEISNLSKPVSGHWYLTLKDEQAQIRCAMFRMKNSRVTFDVQNGMQVLVRANVSLYEPRGDYQVIIETMQPAGDGLLQQQFEALKMKLAGEGLFAQAHKKTLPDFVKRVGIITSSSGAALQDILNVLNRRDPSLEVIIYPTLVQGKEAAQEISEMITLANVRKECDVLIIGRGGGSLEDLWCFNEEIVAYAIYHSHIPIISAVGHETDITIADFVADLRAPTPSAAAELVSRDQTELINQLQTLWDKAAFAFDRLFLEKKSDFERCRLRLNAQHPSQQIHSYQQKLLRLAQQSKWALLQSIQRKSIILLQQEQRLKQNHPLNRLAYQKEKLTRLAYRAEQQMLRQLVSKRNKLQILSRSVERVSLPHQVSAYQQQCSQYSQRMILAMKNHLNREQQRFLSQCAKLDGLSPLKILARGYSMTKTQEGEILLSSDSVKAGDHIVTRLSKGELLSKVVEVR